MAAAVEAQELRWHHLLAVAVVAGVAALAGLPARATIGARLSGDEPQYLLTATSVADDLDLDIADELGAAAYLDYHEVPIDPQTAPLAGGRRISPHDPLLPVLLALPMALGGWAAAKATLAGFAAATAAVTVWLAVRRFDVGPLAAVVVTAGAFAGIPLAAYGGQVYPEMPAALALAVGMGAVTAPARRCWPIALGAGMIVALPWLAVKYVPLAAALALALLWGLRDRRRRQVAVAVALVAAGALYLFVHRRVYGGWTVYASGDHFVEGGEFSVVGTEVSLVGRSRRLTGLLVDGVFGLVPWSPLWALLAPAVGWAGRRWRTLPGLALALLIVTWLGATYVALTMHGWWVPGRQLVVGLPFGAIVIAAWVDGGRRRRWLAGGLGLVGASNWLWLTAEAATGRRTLIVDFAETSAPAFRLLSPLFPDGMRADPIDAALLAGWTLALAAGVVAGAQALPANRGRAVVRPEGISRSAGAAPRGAGPPPGSHRAASGRPPRQDGPRPPVR